MQATLPAAFQDFAHVLNYTLLRERRLYVAGPRLLSLETKAHRHSTAHFRLEHFSNLSPLSEPERPLRTLSIRISKIGEDEMCRYFKVMTGGAGGWFYELVEFKQPSLSENGEKSCFISEFRRGEWIGR